MNRSPLLNILATTLWASFALTNGFASAEERTGSAIYQELCASCHGASGEGVADAYANPLVGDRSIGELARYIDKTMPEGEPEKLNAAESQQVAAFIHEAFYSPTAQARNQPARVELSRLTVRQYRQSVADIIESFRWSNRLKGESGLKGEYFNGRRHRDKDRKIQRVDPVIRFNFEESGPDKDKVEPKEYSIRWLGGVFAPVTGEYEFIIRSENAVRLWVNDQWGKAIIDAGVKSGSDTEYRASLFLIGGRVYPLRLEHHKSEKEQTGSIEFLWKRPQHVDETITARYLTPVEFAETYIVTTPFPPDDRSVGYERGTAVSKAWDEATTNAALDASAYVVAHLDELAGVKGKSDDRPDNLQNFAVRFAETAFRRPLTADERRRFVDEQFAADPNLDAGARRSLLLVLLSPQFLYRELGGGNDAYSVAARLSFALWDSIPDRDLLEAAQRNELQQPDQILRHAERMTHDLRAEGKLREFLHQWLKLDHLHDLSKDASLYPEFTEVIQSDLRSSLDLFLDDVVRSDAADFRQLLLSEATYLNGRLSKFYGVDLPLDAEFQSVSFEPEARAGVLSHPYLMAGFAYHGTSSPIHRGVWIARNVLGRSLRTPPVAVAPLAPDLHEDLTTRERVVLQTSPEMCQSCHSLINPLGFGLEQFDAVGRFRDQEKGKPVDALGTYITRTGHEVKFQGVRELAEFLSSDAETHAAFTEQLFQYLVKQPILAYGPNTCGELTGKFAANQFNIRKLQAEIATRAALLPK